jgi:hypothetical protein
LVAYSGSEAPVELIAILPGGKIISPIVNYFPGGKPFVSFIYNSFSRRHDMGCVILTMTMPKDIN